MELHDLLSGSSKRLRRVWRRGQVEVGLPWVSRGTTVLCCQSRISIHDLLSQTDVGQGGCCAKVDSCTDIASPYLLLFYNTESTQKLR